MNKSSIDEFVGMVKELFPSIDPYAESKTREAVKHIQDDTREKLETCTRTNVFNFLAQGDIFSEIPFTFVDEEGNDRQFNSKALLLSNTCDAERERLLVFVPVIPIETFKKEGFDEQNLINNKYTKLFYLPSLSFQSYVVDFNIVNCVSRQLINKLIESNKLKKDVTLNLIGYYLFLAKLTVHFMRPEDPSVNNDRIYLEV
ncbi:hypothetical protein [Salibacterium qingdaonense]|uniref:Uncharacterized protein n=1 Tax=Salibacterium qingdaonense TaxID=266892 RepID=A0A1I4KQA1_9BACI|nr:hypothetical protein [Salibacterium qingdaonense]SFL80736.1 hypothetical protein SAMN04488054_105150 [Salibacterium qingdaonense]